MHEKSVKRLLGIVTAMALIAAVGGTSMTVYARGGFGGMTGVGAGFGGMAAGGTGFGEMSGGGTGFGGMAGFGNSMSNAELASEPSEIVTSTLTCTAAELAADEENAVTYVMSEENNSVKITASGTYVVTGSCEDGNIVVKKGVTGVVLILKDLDLTSKTGATVSCNKGSEVKIIVQGSVKLTDAEDPADEDSEDAEVADAFDGAAIKVKDGANVFLTGTGSLTIDASNCKNGIKAGDEEGTCLMIDDLTLNISASNDAINAGYDLTILGGTINIWADDDAIHADRILTVGNADGTGPVINVNESYEGLEGTVVNLFGGSVTVNASDDAVNAANSDGTYDSEMSYSINITGGNHTIKSQGDGLDSNGNINITGGNTTISSASNGGEAGIDYDGTCYIADGTVNNNSGISGPDMMPGQQGQQPGGNGRQGQRPDSDENNQQDQADETGQQDMYRLYNPNSGEHFYTANAEEKDYLVSIGWNDEGIAWKLPETSDIPVYRLYNPNAGDHHYTTSAQERDMLISLGWNDEGIGWYSDGEQGEPLYRLYNPNATQARAHHYTADAGERDYLVSIGWSDEGIGWYGKTMR